MYTSDKALRAVVLEAILQSLANESIDGAEKRCKGFLELIGAVIKTFRPAWMAGQDSAYGRSGTGKLW